MLWEAGVRFHSRCLRPLWEEVGRRRGREPFCRGVTSPELDGRRPDREEGRAKSHAPPGCSYGGTASSSVAPGGRKEGPLELAKVFRDAPDCLLPICLPPRGRSRRLSGSDAMRGGFSVCVNGGAISAFAAFAPEHPAPSAHARRRGPRHRNSSSTPELFQSPPQLSRQCRPACPRSLLPVPRCP